MALEGREKYKDLVIDYKETRDFVRSPYYTTFGEYTAHGFPDTLLLKFPEDKDKLKDVIDSLKNLGMYAYMVDIPKVK